jgi:hypothetical protein
MKTKLIVLGVILLVSASLVPLGSAQQAPVPAPQPAADIWSDNYDNYTNGQLLDGTSDDGGWKGWDNVAGCFGTVTDSQARSAPYSDMITGPSDNVHEFTITSGTFDFIAWQYIPNDFSGETYFILLSDYLDGQDSANTWALQITFNSAVGLVESEFDAVTCPLITGRWVELKTSINLTSDFFQFFYDGDLLIEKAWTSTINNNGAGTLELDAVDLYANNSSPVYYDDLKITPPGGEPPQPEPPELQITNITGGKSIDATLTNIGEGNATNVTWSITLNGGLLFKGKITTGNFPLVLAGSSYPLACDKIVGFGKVTIAVSASCDEDVTADATTSGFVFLFWVLGVK